MTLRRRPMRWMIPIAAIALVAIYYGMQSPFRPLPIAMAAQRQPTKAPELDGGIAWLNTSGPVKLADLKGKVVVLDFWTFCCINCIHTLPDLATLEKKFEKELVV